jgi:hypothetical protein
MCCGPEHRVMLSACHDCLLMPSMTALLECHSPVMMLCRSELQRVGLSMPDLLSSPNLLPMVQRLVLGHLLPDQPWGRRTLPLDDPVQMATASLQQDTVAVRAVGTRP